MPTAPRSARKSAKTTPPLRIAIIGTGGMANSHAKHYQAIPGIQLVACVDISRERAAAFATTYGIPAVFTCVSWTKSVVTPVPREPKVVVYTPMPP